MENLTQNAILGGIWRLRWFDAFLGQKTALWRFFEAMEGYFKRRLGFIVRGKLPGRYSLSAFLWRYSGGYS
jgi:hypothetical protein